MTAREIWIVAETRKGSLTKVTRQLLGAARSLATQKELSVVAVLVAGDQAQADELAQLAANVIWLNQAELSPYEATRQVDALGQLIEKRGRPFAVLAGSSSAANEFMPRLAARYQSGYASNCVDLRWEGEELAVRRPVYGGRVYEELAFCQTPAWATFRPGAFDLKKKLASPGQLEQVTIDLPESNRPLVGELKIGAIQDIELSEATRVVAGGRGLGEPQNFELVEQLAQVLQAAIGASRAIVDAGWRPHTEQVGKSGKTISPELYIACGISGAVHHTLGMNTSKVVVAINSDPEATIFKHADYGIVGDAIEILPALTEALKS
ncbi:MAG: electron transfer flavoprotein subunit alpha/FixB family protein [Deltaproteobacteria bacterium]|nr:electron transfer flavoprotein subunit alpha/FixB family protein [Deltaproteobacteria bacterium]MBW1871237.1 electron transfer flavoprotein subunit alpha/FixB family protein [Deltaproteobacteria bacterium]